MRDEYRLLVGPGSKTVDDLVERVAVDLGKEYLQVLLDMMSHLDYLKGQNELYKANLKEERNND